MAQVTLTEFLLARIAEDEDVARTAGPDWISYQKTADYGMDDDTAVHVVTFSPARVLAECEAKRRIVDECRQCDQDNFTPRTETWGYREALRGSVQVLASVYADHPDYLPEWKP